MKPHLILVTCLSLAVASRANAQTSATSTDVDKALRDFDAQMLAAATAKNPDKLVSYYSADAVVLPANGPVATTKDAIRKIWNDLLTAPATSITWKPNKVEVSRSGDMAFLTGTYELSTNDPSGKPVNDRGKYLEVWEKQSDGSWKCAADMWNSDLETPNPAEKE